MRNLFDSEKPSLRSGGGAAGLKALLTMLVNHLLCGGEPDIAKASYIKNRPANVMFKTKLSTVRNNLARTEPYAARIFASPQARAFLKSELIRTTGRAATDAVFIAGKQRSTEQGKEVTTARSQVTVEEWIDEVFQGTDDRIFNEMKNAWAAELTPDAPNEMVIELRKLGGFLKHSNFKLEDEQNGLLSFLKKVYAAHQLYKERAV